jgi:hypothetical protein
MLDIDHPVINGDGTSSLIHSSSGIFLPIESYVGYREVVQIENFIFIRMSLFNRNMNKIRVENNLF